MQALRHHVTADYGVALASQKAVTAALDRGERDLATKEMAQDEARKQEAVQINQLLSQLGLSGASGVAYGIRALMQDLAKRTRH